MKKRMGRPPKKPGERLSKMLRHRVTVAEYGKLIEAARRAGLTLSEYARRKLLGGLQ